ncbi:MAG TPA: phosphoenolpyruvate synthase [Drouetiella sp.]|jgi:pyruvate, water dikinase
MSNYIRSFDSLALQDVQLVGGKNASLGELTQSAAASGINVPAGFVITAAAYDALLKEGNIEQELQELLTNVETTDIEQLANVSKKARNLIKRAGLPKSVEFEICQAYDSMQATHGENIEVAVRSSATAEDLPDASFAGQQESFLNIRGEKALLEACLNCFASLFTDRAISYRKDKGFGQLDVKLSIGVQKMIRSDLASSGVIFTLDPESGFRNVVLVTSAYGLGENVVAGRVDPDEFLIFKSSLATHPKPIIRKKLGTKHLRMVYTVHDARPTKNVAVAAEEQRRFSLDESDILTLARWACTIEKLYSTKYGRETPMDIEWAKDGVTGQLYIVQARPETIHSTSQARVLHYAHLKRHGKVLLSGRAVGDKIGSGQPKVVDSIAEAEHFSYGDVLVADMTAPDWEPIMKKASAIVTNRGGRTCHAAIVSRELGVPCIVGTENATELLKSGEAITVCCAEGTTGIVYEGILPTETEEVRLDELSWTRTRILVNIGNPEHALALASLPVDGVGLAREEFIITNEVKIHPLALTRFERVTDAETRLQIEQLTHGFSSKEEYFVTKLAEGVATIAAAFYPREIVLRLSDFKTNEYASLLGGKYFEPQEENPMIGFRGASRYYDERYRDGFALECRAIKRVREDMGFANVKVMIPFCRSVKEGELVLKEMAKNGLVHGQAGLEVMVMCELPSNVFEMERFATIFDGFSIGSNDLTQLILGLDRDAQAVAHLFDERDPAVLDAIKAAIHAAHRLGRPIGICGQAPSDYPDFVEFLIENRIDSISLNEDAVLKTLLVVSAAEKKVYAAENASLA